MSSRASEQSERDPGPITTGRCYAKAGAAIFCDYKTLWLWVPAFALGHAHISKVPSDDEGIEVFEAVFEGDGAWQTGSHPNRRGDR